MATTREIPLRVLYTINSSPQYILARCTKAKVTTVQDNYATCSLQDCLIAVSRSSPELTPSPTRDYSVYVMDPLEVSPDAVSVAVGLGYMSKALQCNNNEDDVQVCGTVKKTPRGDSLEILFALREMEILSLEMEMQPQASTSRTLRKRASGKNQHPVGYAAANSPQAVELEKLVVVKSEVTKSKVRQSAATPTVSKSALKKKQRGTDPRGAALHDALLAATSAIDASSPKVNDDAAQKQKLEDALKALVNLVDAASNRYLALPISGEYIASPSPAPSTDSPVSEAVSPPPLSLSLDKENVGLLRPPIDPKSISTQNISSETPGPPTEPLKRKRDAEDVDSRRPRTLVSDIMSVVPKPISSTTDLATRRIFPESSEFRPMFTMLNRSTSSVDVKPRAPFGFINVALSSPIRGADTSFAPDTTHRFTAPPRPIAKPAASVAQSVSVPTSVPLITSKSVTSKHSPPRSDESKPNNSFAKNTDPSRVPDRIMGRCYSLPAWAQTGTALRPRLSEDAITRLKAEEEERDRSRKEKERGRRLKDKRSRSMQQQHAQQQLQQQSHPLIPQVASSSIEASTSSLLLTVEEVDSGSDLPILASDFDFDLDFASSQSTCPRTPPPRRSARLQSTSVTPGSKRSQRSFSDSLSFTPSSARSEKSLFTGSPLFSPSPHKGKQSQSGLNVIPSESNYKHHTRSVSRSQHLSPSPPKRRSSNWKGKGRSVTFEQRYEDDMNSPSSSLPIASSDSEIPSAADSDETARPRDDDEDEDSINGVFWGLPPSSPPPPSSPILPAQSMFDEAGDNTTDPETEIAQAPVVFSQFAGLDGPELSPDDYSSTSESMSLPDFSRLFSSDSAQTPSNLSEFTDIDFHEFHADLKSNYTNEGTCDAQAQTYEITSPSRYFDFELAGFWESVQPLVDAQVAAAGFGVGEVDTEKLAQDVQDLFGGCLM